MSEWKNCMKKPVVVQVREVRPNEEGIETLEGFKPCSTSEHLIIKGIRGEEYPIARDIFEETYEYTDEDGNKIIKEANFSEKSTEMAQGQLKSIIEKAQKALGLVSIEVDLEDWVDSKITTAEEYLQTVCDYLEFNKSVHQEEAYQKLKSAYRKIWKKKS